MAVTTTSLGNVYVIRTSKDTSFCYIGSTFNKLHKRFKAHKDQYHLWFSDQIKYKRQKLSIFPYYTKYGFENFDIKLIKDYNVLREHNKDTRHLRVFETLWINKTKNCVNIYPPFNPLNKNKKLEKILRKIYKEKNKDKLKEKYKIYKDNNTEKIKNQRKIWHNTNKEKHKIYYENNREKIKEKIHCPNCNSIVRKHGLSRHRKTFKCNLFKDCVPLYI